MPDLFLGAAAGPPGLPDWIDHAFADPIKNDPDYLATAVAALGALFFQDSVLPELRPLATDPPGEGAPRRPGQAYKRTCHQVTVNASGGQINDKSNALEEKREKKKFEKLKFRYRPPTAHPRMRLGVPHGLSWAKSCLTDPTALLTHCLKARH